MVTLHASHPSKLPVSVTVTRLPSLSSSISFASVSSHYCDNWSCPILVSIVHSAASHSTVSVRPITHLTLENLVIHRVVYYSRL